MIRIRRNDGIVVLTALNLFLAWARSPGAKVGYAGIGMTVGECDVSCRVRRRRPPGPWTLPDVLPVSDHRSTGIHRGPVREPSVPGAGRRVVVCLRTRTHSGFRRIRGMAAVCLLAHST